MDVGGAVRGGGTGATGRAALAGLSRDRGRSRRRSGESSRSRRRLSPRSLDFDLRRRGERDLLRLLGILWIVYRNKNRFNECVREEEGFFNFGLHTIIPDLHNNKTA